MNQITLWGIVGLLVALLATSGYAYVEREQRIAAVERAAQAEATTASLRVGLESLREEIQAAEQRRRANERIRRDVASAPDTRACADSPAVRAALRGLYAPSGAAGGAAGPDRPAGPARPAP